MIKMYTPIFREEPIVLAIENLIKNEVTKASIAAV